MYTSLKNLSIENTVSIPALLFEDFRAFQHGICRYQTSISRRQWKYDTGMITRDSQLPRMTSLPVLAPYTRWR
jgi:hypothetical protein